MTHGKSNASDPDAIDPVPFNSILFPGVRREDIPVSRVPPVFFHDLALDQIVAAVTTEWSEYDLPPFFFTPLRDLETVVWRQEVMRDLERPGVLQAIGAFSNGMRTSRRHLERSGKVYYKQEKERWFLNAGAVYSETVERLLGDLQGIELASRGLQSFRAYLAAYCVSSEFTRLVADTTRLVADLSALRYSLLISSGSVTVRSGGEEPNYTTAVEGTFERFRSGAVRDYRVGFPETQGLNHVEAQVLHGVALLNPDVFQALETHRTVHADYLNETIARFEREIHFYVAYLKHVTSLSRDGLGFCYPIVSEISKSIGGHDAFDLALAGRLAKTKSPVVRNDFALHGAERIFVVSGPNQGGKTTFARMIGQLHYLASLGLPVPGSDARLFLCDRIFTHFEREEDTATLRGKLEDDLVRLREILDEATPNSLIILNEVFSSTTLEDALRLGRRVMTITSGLDTLCVWVTFLTELASFDMKTVSIVSTIDPRDPSVRTYKLERRAADGLAYAMALAEKHRVTYDWLKERIRP